MIKNIIRNYRKVFKASFLSFLSDNATKLSGSLAYRAIFSFPPFLLLVFIVGGYFYGRAAVQGEVFDKLNGVIGAQTALQVQDVIKGLSLQSNSLVATVLSVTALVIGATALFTEIQSSLNMIWGVRTTSKRGFLKLLLNRLISFLMIIGLGILLTVALFTNALILTLGHFILAHFSWLPLTTISISNQVFLLVVLFFLFAFIFKVLPDVRLRWVDVHPAAFVTTVLFFIGKFVIELYIRSSLIITIYGAAGSIIILLAWVYFSAMIFYFGVEFSRAWVLNKGIIPKPTSLAEQDEKGLWLGYLKKTGNK